MSTLRHFNFINMLIDKSGPDVEDYEALDQWNLDMRQLAAEGQLSEQDRQRLVESGVVA